MVDPQLAWKLAVYKARSLAKRMYNRVDLQREAEERLTYKFYREYISPN